MNDRQQMKEHYRQIVKEKYGIENFDIEPVKTERECPVCDGTGGVETLCAVGGCKHARECIGE